MKKKRYFIVVFCANSNNGNVTGSIDVISNNGLHLNRVDTVENIKMSNTEYNLSGIIITNIIEMSERDFKNWIKQ